MNRIHNILVIVDPTASQHQAVDKGALLAGRFDARLELFVCETKASQQARAVAHARNGAAQPLITNMKAFLESLAQPLRERGLDVTTDSACADPLHAGLIDRTKRTSADLVIKDTHHHTLAQRTFLTNTDWELIRRCPVPLLLVKAKPWPVVPRIIAALDPGHVNDKPLLLDNCILDQATAFSNKLGGELHVLHSYIPMAIIAGAPAMPPMVATVSATDLLREQEAKLKQVSAVVSDYRIAPAHIHLEVGGPAEVLPRMAQVLDADIMAMGAISRSGLKRVFIGSTAEDVLERLPCDALIVKTPDFAELLPF
jgi:universal stress protein E